MRVRLLFGTTNQAKLNRLRAVLQSLPVEVLGLNDVAISVRPEEDGATPHDNAVKKALTYHAATGLPTFSIDAGLYIDRFPMDRQPGVHVRRIDGREATDTELLLHYRKALSEVGGETTGYWMISVVFVASEETILSRDFKEETFFTIRQSPIVTPGEPLSSIQFDRTFGKYKSEITPEERASLDNAFDQALAGFLAECLDKMVKVEIGPTPPRI